VNVEVSGLVVDQHLSGRAIAYRIFPHMGTVRVLDSAPSESRGPGAVRKVAAPAPAPLPRPQRLKASRAVGHFGTASSWRRPGRGGPPVQVAACLGLPVPLVCTVRDQVGGAGRCRLGRRLGVLDRTVPTVPVNLCRVSPLLPRRETLGGGPHPEGDNHCGGRLDGRRELPLE
jgi:hypothetical protein